MTRALIDGDIIVYRAACSANGDPEYIALSRADKMLHDILLETGVDSYALYLTGSNNFRRELTATYKASRPAEKPMHWQAVRDYLVRSFGAQIIDGKEADDEMGISQDKHSDTTIICSIDKDLKQIPGKHYNFVKKEWDMVTKSAGYRFLFYQAIVGDASDNIKGITGMGPVKANAYLNTFCSMDYYEAVRMLYGDDDRYHMNLSLLYIWQQEDDSWERFVVRVTPPENTDDET